MSTTLVNGIHFVFCYRQRGTNWTW